MGKKMSRKEIIKMINKIEEDEKVSSASEFLKEPELTDEEINALDLEDHIIEEHNEELDALAFIQESATEHNNQGTFNEIKEHAKAKTAKPKDKSVNEVQNQNKDYYADYYYDDYYTKY